MSEIDELKKAKEIQFFWDSQAKQYGSDIKAVNGDPHMEKITENAILDNVPLGSRLTADIGCGNGVLVVRLSKLLLGTVIGCDYSEKMIEVCQKRDVRLGVLFSQSDITQSPVPGEPCETVIGKRVLINVGGRINRRCAMRNIAASLRTGGRYIMAECFKEPLDLTNRLRAAADLPAIKPRWHNEYLDFDETMALADEFGLKAIRIRDPGSYYYMVSRVLSPAMGGEDYYSPQAIMAAKISPKIEELALPAYAPERIIVFSKN